RGNLLLVVDLDPPPKVLDTFRTLEQRGHPERHELRCRRSVRHLRLDNLAPGPRGPCDRADHQETEQIGAPPVTAGRAIPDGPRQCPEEFHLFRHSLISSRHAKSAAGWPPIGTCRDSCSLR